MNSKQWRTLRNDWITDHPICEMCKSKGFIRAARCVHHITPVESGRTEAAQRLLAFSPSNLQALCYECHSEVHKDMRSRTKAGHRAATASRLEAWKAKHKRGGVVFSEGEGSTPNPLMTPRVEKHV